MKTKESILDTESSIPSKRGNQWTEFSFKVYGHVETYTVPQYGDAPNDQAEGWTFNQCIESIKRYCNRAGTNARAGEQQRDLLKIAHYACLASEKYSNEDKVKKIYKSREYCESIGCISIKSKAMCKGCSAYHFHKYLQTNGYKIIR